MSQLFLNHYRCPTCKHEWDDQWPAMCDDDCPKCGARHISPYESEAVQQTASATDKPNASVFGDADLISVYTRAQAIEDGVLVDVSTQARPAGFRYPVALTSAVWSECVEWTDEDTQRQVYQEQAARLWDVLWMARSAIKRYVRDNIEAVSFPMHCVPRDGTARQSRLIRLKVHCGPGDLGLPVFTIMYPHED